MNKEQLIAKVQHMNYWLAKFKLIGYCLINDAEEEAVETGDLSDYEILYERIGYGSWAGFYRKYERRYLNLKQELGMMLVNELLEVKQP